MARSLSASAQATADGILELKKQGFNRSQIIKAGYPRSTVYKVWPVDRSSTLSVPEMGAAPDATEARVNVQMSHEQFARLGTHPQIVAGMMLAEKDQRDSLRKRILRALCAEGDFPDVLTMMAFMRRPDDNFGSHEVTHIIKSLKQQGFVTFRDNRQGSTIIPVNIGITDRGIKEAGLGPMPRQLETTDITRTGKARHQPGWSRAKHAAGKDYTEQRYHGPVASGGDVLKISAAEQVPMGQPLDSSGGLERPEAAAPSVPATTVDLSTYPLLSGLLGRFEENAARADAAARYAEAAAALEAIDPKRSEELLDLAMQAGGEPFSPLEIEMLRLLQELIGRT